jgi:hypothetical protein
MSDTRQDAAVLLIEVLKRSLNPAEHSAIEGWLDVRSEDEGGFLWLAALLSVPPRWLDCAIRTMLTAPRRERDRLRKRLLAFDGVEN